MDKKILILSTWDNQGSGGASYKISRFLIEAGYQVALMVRDRSRSDSFIIQVPLPSKTISQRIINRLFKRRQVSIRTVTEYSFLNFNEGEKHASADAILARLPFTPDLILTGLVSGFVNTETLAELKIATGAQAYTLNVDMAPLTGGCHYSWDCRGYETDCSNCPAILDEQYKDRARENLAIKIKNARKGDIRLLAGSGWTYAQAKRSTLFKNQDKIYNINSCIDTRVFNDKNRAFAKKIFGLSTDVKIIFTGASFVYDKRKGIPYFVEAMHHLWDSIDENERSKIHILIAGRATEENEFIKQIPFQKDVIDFIEDARLLSLAYQAADIFVCPSIQDAGPMMVSEALACGTPVVGFEMGVLCNMVINDYNGYKATLKDSKDLAYGMQKILALTPEQFETYSKNGVDQVLQYSSQFTVVDIIGKILSDVPVG